MVDLKRFVNINIQPHETANVVTTRDTVVLFTPDGASGKVSNFSSMKEVEAYVSTLSGGNTYDIAKAYLQMYFNNGGIKAEVHEGIAYSAVTKAMITALPNDKLYVVIASTDVDNANCYTKVKSLVKSLNEDNNIYGINEKLLLVRTTDYSDDTSEIKNEVKNLVVKYSTQLGAEMTMAAYLSKIDVSEADSIYDYMFTVENITAEDVTTDNYDTIIANDMNVDIVLANKVRDCGGNCKDGDDFVNNFVRIVLQQTLTDSLLNLLTQKVKNSSGIAKIYATTSEELEKYKTCGYLTTDKVWEDDDLKVTRNDMTYTIINKGDALLNGYVVKVLPVAALNASEKAANSTPPIYVILADQYGIRKITINGEVI